MKSLTPGGAFLNTGYIKALKNKKDREERMN